MQSFEARIKSIWSRSVLELLALIRTDYSIELLVLNFESLQTTIRTSSASVIQSLLQES